MQLLKALQLLHVALSRACAKLLFLINRWVESVQSKTLTGLGENIILTSAFLYYKLILSSLFSFHADKRGKESTLSLITCPYLAVESIHQKRSPVLLKEEQTHSIQHHAIRPHSIGRDSHSQRLCQLFKPGKSLHLNVPQKEFFHIHSKLNKDCNGPLLKAVHDLKPNRNLVYICT